MKEWNGLYFPDTETHLLEWMEKANRVVDGKLTYQYHKYEAAVKYCDQRRTAVDIGANIGLWSRVLSLDFDRVHSFEPVRAYQECLEMNAQASNVELHRVALGEQEGIVNMACKSSTSCGDSFVAVGSDNLIDSEIQMVTLDSLKLQNVDLIKIDNEGFEYFGLKGGLETIKQWKPVIIVEQKPGNAAKFGLSDTAAVQMLEGIGMMVRQVISGDYIMTF